MLDNVRMIPGASSFDPLSRGTLGAFSSADRRFRDGFLGVAPRAFVNPRGYSVERCPNQDTARDLNLGDSVILSILRPQ